MLAAYFPNAMTLAQTVLLTRIDSIHPVLKTVISSLVSVYTASPSSCMEFM
jgi:hypothetical protein